MSLSGVALIANGIYNLESSRFGKAPLDERTEGWTEKWGVDPASSEEASSTYCDHDEGAVADLLATPHPQLPLILTQFRPAWLEQLVLRMSGIPHIVINSRYIANEATGALPYLHDLRPDSPPALVGRNHPTNLEVPTDSRNSCSSSSIVEYLCAYRNVDLDADLAGDDYSQDRSLSKCLTVLVENELQPLLLHLRYNDIDAWEQVYRRQYLCASATAAASIDVCSESKNGHWILHLKGRFQASMERSSMRDRYKEFSKDLTVPKAVERVRTAYQALEEQLKSHGKKYLLGTDRPTLVDAILWSHVAEALCDVHLVVVLADFTLLVQHFERLYKTYFTSTPGSEEKWQQWNQEQNAMNAFQQHLPLADDPRMIDHGFKDAIDLMQGLSAHKQELQAVLDAATKKRSLEPWQEPEKETKRLLYRWRMGEDLGKTMEDKKNSSESNAEDNPMRKKLLRDQQRNDQVWMSAIAGVSVVAMLLLQSSAS